MVSEKSPTRITPMRSGVYHLSLNSCTVEAFAPLITSSMPMGSLFSYLEPFMMAFQWASTTLDCDVRDCRHSSSTVPLSKSRSSFVALIRKANSDSTRRALSRAGRSSPLGPSQLQGTKSSYTVSSNDV